MFLIFHILQARPPNVAGPGVTHLPTLPLDGPGCVNNALINAFENQYSALMRKKINASTALMIMILSRLFSAKIALLYDVVQFCLSVAGVFLVLGFISTKQFCIQSVLASIQAG